MTDTRRAANPLAIAGSRELMVLTMNLRHFDPLGNRGAQPI
jgi:hypothetical protein